MEHFCSIASAHLLLLLMAKSIHDDSAFTAATCWTFIVTPTVISPQLMAPKSRVSNARLFKYTSIRPPAATTVYCIYTIKFHNNLGSQAHYLLLCILYNQRDATYTMSLITVSALHVSGGFSSYHQELIKLYMQPWKLSCSPAVYRWYGWVGTTHPYQR